MSREIKKLYLLFCSLVIIVLCGAALYEICKGFMAFVIHNKEKEGFIALAIAWIYVLIGGVIERIKKELLKRI